MVKLAKKNKKSAKQKVNPAASNSSGKKSKEARRSLPQYVVAHTNPFHEGALGVKIPDQNSAPSGTAVSYNRISATIDNAYGGWVSAFRYHPMGYLVAASGVTSTTSFSWQAAFGGRTPLVNQSALASQYGAVRTAAWGIQLSCRQSLNNAQGTVHIAQIPDILNGSTWEYPTSVAQMQACGGYKNIKLSQLCDKPHTEVGKFTDFTAFRYVDPGSADTGAPGVFPVTGWTTIVVFVEGASLSTTVLEIDTIHHFEGLQSQGQGINPITQSAPFSPSLIAAVSYVADTISTGKQIVDPDSDSKFWGDVRSAFTTGLSIANGVASGLEMLAPIFI